MKLLIGVIVLTQWIAVSYGARHNQGKVTGKFDKKFQECAQTAKCMNRPNDDNCIYQCASMECYEEIITSKGVFLEYGEVDNTLRKSFEHCWTYKDRIKKSQTRPFD